MSKCPYLEYKGGSYFLTSSTDDFICKLCNRIIAHYSDDPQIKYTCDSDSGSKFYECPIYKAK